MTNNYNMQMVPTKGGKLYAPVSERVKAFRNQFPMGCITTNIYHVDLIYAVITAEVYDDKNQLLGKASALERRPTQDEIDRKVNAIKQKNAKKNQGWKTVDPETVDINIINWLENAETSAVGRALAFAGFGGDGSIASFEDIIKNYQYNDYLVGEFQDVNQPQQQIAQPPQQQQMSMQQPPQQPPQQQGVEQPTDFNPQNYEQKTPPPANKNEKMSNDHLNIFAMYKEKGLQTYLDRLAVLYQYPNFKAVSNLEPFSNLIKIFNKQQMETIIIYAEKMNVPVRDSVNTISNFYNVEMNQLNEKQLLDFLSFYGLYLPA